MTFPSPTMTQDRKDDQSYSPVTCSSKQSSHLGSGGWTGPTKWTPALRSKHAAASTQDSPALRRAPGGPRTETGKLMHGLVSQRAVPSPQTEYLGITYFEGSNADRSSALGLRLNQQNKMKKNKNIPCDINNATCAICKMLRQA